MWLLLSFFSPSGDNQDNFISSAMPASEQSSSTANPENPKKSAGFKSIARVCGGPHQLPPLVSVSEPERALKSFEFKVSFSPDRVRKILSLSSLSLELRICSYWPDSNNFLVTYFELLWAYHKVNLFQPDFLPSLQAHALAPSRLNLNIPPSDWAIGFTISLTAELWV